MPTERDCKEPVGDFNYALLPRGALECLEAHTHNIAEDQRRCC